MSRFRLILSLGLVLADTMLSQTPENVLVVVNQTSAISRSIGDYYVLRRKIPLLNICRITVSSGEEISRADYDRSIAAPIGAYLRSRHIEEHIFYIVTTSGVPLKIPGTGGVSGDAASVDSELTLLYQDLRGLQHALSGPIRNPLFARRGIKFSHPDFPMYLVTRLTGYDFVDVKGMIDRSLVARNQGKFVIDLSSSGDEPGNDWLRTAALTLPKDRVVFDESAKVLLNETDVIGYASWGSNDKNRKQRNLGFKWLPGAIATEFVSTDGRTFSRPPDNWNIGSWQDKRTWFAGAPQTLTADFIHEGATGASGHVYEPYLTFTPRPDYLLPAYFTGHNLAESYYLSIPALSWMNIVVGDPLCALGQPR
jgi:uncharacterized protein (TIGR03790 family)